MTGSVCFLYICILLFVSEAKRYENDKWKVMLPDVLLQEVNPYSLDSVETTTYDPNLYTEPTQDSNYTQSEITNDTSTTSENQTDSDFIVSDSIEEEKDDYSELDDILHVYYSGDSYDLMVGDTSDSDEFDVTPLIHAYPKDDNSSDTDSAPLIKREAEESEAKGDDSIKGDLQFVLITSFVDGERGTGKVWTVPKDFPESASVLVAGLQKPTGVCFDVNNKFLYVTDPGLENDGFIYQYEVQWDEDQEFLLISDSYVVIIQGTAPYDCSVDQYGNLFYVDYLDNTINLVSYSDLWSGNKNQQSTLYARTDESIPISYPAAIDVINSQDLWYINSLKCDVYGLLDYAKADTEDLNEESIISIVYSEYRGWGVTVSESNYAFFTISTGEIFAYDIESEEDTHLKTKEFLEDPRGLCYGDGFIFVADFKQGIVYKLHDNDKEEQPEPYIRIEGAYNVFCINSSRNLMLSLVFILIILIF